MTRGVVERKSKFTWKNLQNQRNTGPETTENSKKINKIAQKLGHGSLIVGCDAETFIFN